MTSDSEKLSPTSPGNTTFSSLVAPAAAGKAAAAGAALEPASAGGA